MESSRIAKLEEMNKILQNKMRLLRIQLKSQTEFHSAACYYRKIQPFAACKTSRCNDKIINVTQPIAKETHNPPNGNTKTTYEYIIDELNSLQKDFENLREQSQNQIIGLERQLSARSSYSKVPPMASKMQLSENVELINLRRLVKKQETEIDLLNMQLESRQRDSKLIDGSIAKLNQEKDDLLEELSKERNTVAKLELDLVSIKETLKLNEEFVNDLQNEKKSLKEHNENLLKLSLTPKESKEMSSVPAELDLSHERLLKMEENLKREITSKSDLLLKLEDSESLIAKLQDQLSKLYGIISDLQKNNFQYQAETGELKYRMARQSELCVGSKIFRKENKSTMTTIITSTEQDVKMNEGSILHKEEYETKIKLNQISGELNHCMDLLRVQHGINNKYKDQIQELQKTLKFKEDVGQELRGILRCHAESLLDIYQGICQNDKFAEIHGIVDAIHQVLNRGESLDVLRNILEAHRDFIRDRVMENESANAAKLKEDESVQVEEFDILNRVKPIRRGSYTIHKKEFDAVELTDANEQQSGMEGAEKVEFELHISDVTFEKFPESLSNYENRNIFLTWNFLDDERQAYTPAKPANEANFDCSCFYKGPCSMYLLEFLAQRGIDVEIHSLREDISIRIANAKIDTNECVIRTNEKCPFVSDIVGRNVTGRISGFYKLLAAENVLNKHSTKISHLNLKCSV